MKIKIAQGQNVDEALEKIRKFLTENYSEYPIIKSDASVYITLRNEDGQICPDNEKEFTFYKNHIADVSEHNKNQALAGTIMLWNNYTKKQARAVNGLKRQIKTDESYIETAEEKKRKPENVEKRKKELEERYAKLKSIEKFYNDWVCKINKLIEEGLFTEFYVKHTFGSAYEYDLSCILIFENINGKTVHFDETGSLKEGFPKTYKN